MEEIKTNPEENPVCRHLKAGAGLPRRCHRRHAFTLVEAMIAVAITSIGLAAASALVSFNLRAAYFVNSRMVAITIARNRIELLRTVPFVDLPLYREGQIRINNDGFPDPNGRFLRSTNIGSLVDATRSAGVTVTSTGISQSQNVNMALSTIIMDTSMLVIGK